MQNKIDFSNIFILEGNIGAGKSTFLKIIRSKLNLSIIQEPANKWQDMEGSGNLLNLFYQDTKRWALTFQTYAFVNRYQTVMEHLKNSSAPVHILERSVFCDRFCFAQNCHEMGFMTDLEWKIYTDTFSWLVENFTQPPAGFIYLRTTPQTCFERIHKRNRLEEQSIQLSYLELLHKKHDDWLIHKRVLPEFLKNIPVLTLDCDHNFEKNVTIQDEHLQRVTVFINQAQNSNFSQAKKHPLQETQIF
jgi:deoxyadenosine/deoxycytidine kinase